LAPTPQTDFKEVLRDLRREQIVDTARRLFEERRTTEVSMEEIASEAGVSRSTVYVYFANRDELLTACLQRMHSLLMEALEPAWSPELDPADALRLLVHSMLARIDENPAFFLLAVAAAGTGRNPGSPLGAQLSLIGMDVVALLVEILGRGVESGRFRSFDLDRAAAFVGQQLFGAMYVRADDPARLPLDEAADGICSFLLEGLGAPAR
jgi:AcrR family transcriptional regulator